MPKKKLNKKFIIFGREFTIKQVFYFGVILITIGIILLSSDYLYMKKIKIFDDMNYKIFLNTKEKHTTQEVGNDDKIDSKQIKNKQAAKYDTSLANYIGMIEIKKINLKRGLVAKGSYANRVSRNVQTLKESSYPNVPKGNFILAAHSGNGYNAYFRNLYKLNKNDTVNIYYNNIKYTYQINNIYLQNKTGKLTIYRDKTKNTLTLITCTKNSRTKQTVYIAYLVSYVEY